MPDSPRNEFALDGFQPNTSDFETVDQNQAPRDSKYSDFHC
jgi:hypothetical protein